MEFGKITETKLVQEDIITVDYGEVLEKIYRWTEEFDIDERQVSENTLWDVLTNIAIASDYLLTLEYNPQHNACWKIICHQIEQPVTYPKTEKEKKEIEKYTNYPYDQIPPAWFVESWINETKRFHAASSSKEDVMIQAVLIMKLIRDGKINFGAF